MGSPSSDLSPPRRVSVHHALGGGSVADVLLWRSWSSSAAALIASVMTWFALERCGYSVMSFTANVLLLLVVILFIWAKSASLLNRPMPPLPDLKISEENIDRAAGVMLELVNSSLSVVREITIERNFRLFVQVASSLWFISFFGSIFNFLTLVYIGIVLVLFGPLVYEKYQDLIDEKLHTTWRTMQMQCRYIDDTYLKNLPMPSMKEKKIQ
ncbi:hypothetical protein MLD38_032118 [Melastoma candidum]|uniref:Uncharacterized protein n=1 Tax=Melastoma candidum TaxID=119954 RepID=A0ACB9M2S8_9MYRT|nr:hypothetical protein MLD38_032118 [Melastoma candidum]